jgi:hypothetical protein
MNRNYLQELTSLELKAKYRDSTQIASIFLGIATVVGAGAIYTSVTKDSSVKTEIISHEKLVKDYAGLCLKENFEQQTLTAFKLNENPGTIQIDAKEIISCMKAQHARAQEMENTHGKMVLPVAFLLAGMMGYWGIRSLSHRKNLKEEAKRRGIDILTGEPNAPQPG